MMTFTARDRLRLLLGGSTAVLAGCGGGGGTTPNASSFVSSTATGSTTPATTTTTTPTTTPTNTAPATGLLKTTFRNNFEIGTAMKDNLLGVASNPAESLVIDQFNSVTPEYELKADQIAPTEGIYNFDAADRLVDWALENDLTVRGHALVWHESTPDYFLTGTPADIKGKLETYIQTVMTHFSGRIRVWDVVNEALSTDIYDGVSPDGPFRRSAWYEAVGSAEYIDWAFLAARAADPTAALFFSDYETENTIKRGYLGDFLTYVSDRNLPVDGIGHQAHLNLESSAADILAAIDLVDGQFMNLINHITEMDISFYNDPGTCWETGTNCLADVGETPPDDMVATQAILISEIFAGLQQRASVENVTLWGAHDGESWLNYVPAIRFNHPLLFTRTGEPKPAFHILTDPNYTL